MNTLFAMITNFFERRKDKNNKVRSLENKSENYLKARTPEKGGTLKLGQNIFMSKNIGKIIATSWNKANRRSSRLNKP